MDEADLTVAAVIRQARIMLGYTQMDVAEMADMSWGEYQRIEYGKRSVRNMSMKHGLALCKALHLDPYQLVFGKQWSDLE
ncbi:MAG: hypothetical protein CW338_11555 [Clostridiales bacterium]|jgi:Helix-turn-helix.|nr:hypothetical protein [Clostridiales bacterium]